MKQALPTHSTYECGNLQIVAFHKVAVRVCPKDLNRRFHLQYTSTTVACGVGPSVVTTFSTDFSFPKPGFLEFIGVFSQQKSLKNQYLPHILNPNLTK
jgi:hypothetical protein